MSKKIMYIVQSNCGDEWLETFNEGGATTTENIKDACQFYNSATAEVLAEQMTKSTGMKWHCVEIINEEED